MTNGKFTAVGLLLMLLVATSARVESHSLPPLEQLIANTGLHEQASEANELEERLVEEMAALYRQEAEVHEHEHWLLDKVGLSRPDGKQKGELENAFATHLKNMDKLEALRLELSEEVARVRGKE